MLFSDLTIEHLDMSRTQTSYGLGWRWLVKPKFSIPFILIELVVGPSQYKELIIQQGTNIGASVSFIRNRDSTGDVAFDKFLIHKNETGNSRSYALHSDENIVLQMQLKNFVLEWKRQLVRHFSAHRRCCHSMGKHTNNDGYGCETIVIWPVFHGHIYALSPPSPAQGI